MDGQLRIRFGDLGRSNADLRHEIDSAVADVLDSGWYVLGEQGRTFEAEFASYCGAAHAVGVASGTDAIELALRALGIGPDDEVITQANTCVPTVAGIERSGAMPVLCDVEPETATMDPASAAEAVSGRTRAIVPVHLYGQCANMEAIRALAAERALVVVEDCAQAHGAMSGGHPAGTMGAAGCFSFYPTKNLGALGDGGAVVTADGTIAERLRLLRQYGQSDRYLHVARGVNSRLDELQAAVLRVKLPHLQGWTRRRAEIAAVYTEALEGTSVRPLARLAGSVHAFHLFVVRAPNRARFQAELERRGVGTLIHYPVPIHGHESYGALAEGPVSLANAEAVCNEVVSLPLYPQLTDAEVTHIAHSARHAAHV